MGGDADEGGGELGGQGAVDVGLTGCGPGVDFVKIGEFGEEGARDVREGAVGEVVPDDEEGEGGEGEDGEKVKVGKSRVEG